MMDLFSMPAYEPRARATDPQTSHDAAKKFKGTRCISHYDAILGVLFRPMTPPEIAKLTGLSVVQIDRRRKELVDRGAITLTGIVRDGYAEWRKVL